MKDFKKLIEHDGLKNATHIEVSVCYSKGGANYFSGNVLRRGYYLRVTPVSVGNGLTSFTLFSGLSKFLFETSRYSDKQFDRAVEMSKEFEEELVSKVVAENKAA